MRRRLSVGLRRSSDGFRRHERDAGVRRVDEAVDRQARKRDRAQRRPGASSAIADILRIDGVRAIERGAVGQLRERDEIVLVLRRHESLRHAREPEPRQADQADVEHDRHRRPRAARAPRRRCRALDTRVKNRLKSAEEPAEQRDRPRAARGRVDASRGASSRDASAGLERQRVERRDDGRDRDRQRELPVELPGQPADEGGRHEHGAQHERDRDDRARTLPPSPRRVASIGDSP